jgi:hypothetical protein
MYVIVLVAVVKHYAHVIINITFITYLTGVTNFINKSRNNNVTGDGGK